MRWDIYTRNGDHIATVKFAAIAARVAISEGIGARVCYDGRHVHRITEATARDGAAFVADYMLAIIRRKAAA